MPLINALLAGTMLLTPTLPTAPWQPPPGYTFEHSYFGGTLPCDQAGSQGLQDGRWNAYLCHEVLRKAADLWFVYGDLYVRRGATQIRSPG